MPHIDSNTPDPENAPMTVEAAQRVEQERLTRRAALRKLGFGAGLAAFSLLGVDDFARMVGKRLERNARDNQTALAVAKEFQSAGIALAESPSNGAPCTSNLDCSGCPTVDDKIDCCYGSDHKNDCCAKNFKSDAQFCQSCCESAYTYPGVPFNSFGVEYRDCLKGCPVDV